MSPKEKAQELVDRFREFADGPDPEIDRYSPNIEKQKAKQCALIAVDEILEIELLVESVDDYYLRYWQEVKQEIEKL